MISTRRGRVKVVTLLSGSLLLAQTGCGDYASALDSAGPQAQAIESLTYLLTGIGTAVFLVVLALLYHAVRTGSRRADVLIDDDSSRKLGRAVTLATVATTAILVLLLAVNFTTGRALAAFGDPDALTIQIVGHQWWWEIVYEDPSPDRRLTTANEIYIPVGRRIRLIAQSRDVIHSFWAPNLHGKFDLIPGYGTGTTLQADREGVFRGRCAEFCGMQHAHMDFQVVAVSADSFEVWYANQLRGGAEPTDTLVRRGQEVFQTRSCVLCHTVRGTPAGGRVGPDLTHVASRARLAAGTLPNTRGHLAGWILDPQSIKPGANMPPTALSANELRALLAYLESLR